jgi:hypothetical protein
LAPGRLRVRLRHSSLRWLALDDFRSLLIREALEKRSERRVAHLAPVVHLP